MLCRSGLREITSQVANAKKHLFSQKQGDKLKPYCLFCRKQEHGSEDCTLVTTLADRKKFFVDHNLCFNCGRSNHRSDQYRRRGCAKCKYRHHTSICDRPERESSNPDGVSLTVYTKYAEEKVLPAIIPVGIKGEVLWAYQDTGSRRNFISREAVKLLKLKPTRHETREILTVNGTKVQTMPIFDTHIKSLDFSRDSEKARQESAKVKVLTYTAQEVLHDVHRRTLDTPHSRRLYL